MSHAGEQQCQAYAEEEVWPNVLKVVVRVLLWPYLAVVELVCLPFRFAWDESDEYILASHGWLRTLVNGCLELIEADYNEDVKLVWSRIISAYNISLAFVYQVTIYNVVLTVCQKLGIAIVVKGLMRRIEWLLSKMFSGFYTTDSDVSCVYSIVNVIAPEFDVPKEYDIQSPRFPIIMDRESGSSPIDHPFNAHFMSQFAKLAYEHPLVIKDVIASRWGLRFDGFACNRYAGTDAHYDEEQLGTLKFRPDVAGYVCSNSNSIMIAFVGADALDLVSWRSDACSVMNTFSDIGGVHAEFYNALFEPRENCLFDQIVSIVNGPGNASKSIFLTGHSSGGALASVFAQTATRYPDLQRRIKGIFTFGQPRTGNSAYRARFEQVYGDPLIALRFVFGNDLVPKVPCGLGFKHHISERFITSFNRIVADPEDIQDCRENEDRHAFIFGAIKLATSPLHGESFLRMTLRAALICLPGILDHLPAAYEHALRVHAVDFRAEGFTRFAPTKSS
ncbi:Fungal lipase-like domain-containing protein [Plasmodiophora brassicae]|uniref:Fungal lipase-type domain-containing protein n=1 Tax=Plasmodiophora brassicae TaxID=37360 RepID=A0A3P3Y1V6_PLABS|nr:unnamed protein product [Plasmodiophora brassicae]